MIPLIRPEFPKWQSIEKHFKRSRVSGAISNFGPCFQEVVDRASLMTDFHSLPVNTGTDAIRIALQTKLKRGARVLIPDYTHIGTLQAVVQAGMEPILVGCDRSTWNISAEEIDKLPTNFYDAFIVVSPFGYTVDFNVFDDLALMKRKEVIYDLAGAWGMELRTNNTVCFSLHATKNFSCGEGGIVGFKKRSDFNIAKRLVNFDTLPDRTVASPFGTNLKPDELKCAVILAQLDNHDDLMDKAKRKRDLIDYYQKNLSCLPHIRHKGNSAPSLCVLSGMPAEHLEKESKLSEIVMKQYYPPLSSMPGLSTIRRFSVCSPFFRTCLALPSDVSQDEADRVIAWVRETVAGARAFPR